MSEQRTVEIFVFTHSGETYARNVNFTSSPALDKTIENILNELELKQTEVVIELVPSWDLSNTLSVQEG